MDHLLLRSVYLPLVLRLFSFILVEGRREDGVSLTLTLRFLLLIMVEMLVSFCGSYVGVGAMLVRELVVLNTFNIEIEMRSLL